MGGKGMTEHKFVVNLVCYTCERAEMYRDILEPVLKKAQADNPVLPYVTYVIEELPEG